MDIMDNDYIRLEEERDSIFITVHQHGYLLSQVDQVLRELPRITVTKFAQLKEALEVASKEKVHIGEWKPLVAVSINEDKMTAKIRLHVSEQQWIEEMDDLIKEVLSVLHSHGIKVGLIDPEFSTQLVPNKDMIVARGQLAIHGKDAVIRYFQMSERKPTIRDDGKADYFELNFIDEVKAGDWLGEKQPPTEGKPGKNVYGEVLLPKKGKDRPLYYDPKTVEKLEIGGTVILKALVDGVVQYIDGKISVGNHLLIDGDVGVRTGNIHFNGSVTIKGIVLTGFSVKASRDISILGEFGISGAKEIHSVNGDIFIKGGVFGNNVTVIKAAKNIYIKHANECFLEAGEDIHIGYYALGTMMKGSNIIANDQQGKIIGGSIEAKGSVSAAIFGNKMERKTYIQIEGFDRVELEKDLSELLQLYKEKILHIETIKKQLEVFETSLSELNESQLSKYKHLKQTFEQEMTDVSYLEARRKYSMKLLETKGEGQVTIQKAAYPATTLQIKHLRKHVQTTIKGTIYCEKNSLHSE